MVEASSCPECRTALLPTDRYCGRCGTEVRRCTACGALGSKNDRFCGECGRDFTGPIPALGDSAPSASVWNGVIDLLRDATLGEFDVLGEIGRGGMAIVVLAHQIAVNRKVAIKVMSPGILANDGMIERFRQEAITVGNLKHANIVAVYDVRQVGDLNFFIMEYVDGKALDRVLAAKGSLSFPAARSILAQVGGALAYAHRKGVLHRDVKPGNILLNTEGDAFVTDFGIAKVIEAPNQTSTGAVHGTAAYMSPEQCYAYALTPAADQYSLGVVAYELLAGRPPFEGNSSFGLMQAHTTLAPPPIAEFRPDCPVEMAAAIHRMLAKKPEDRWPTITEALAALSAFPVLPGDPVRDELITLVDAGSQPRLGDLFRTPVSPIPPAKRNSGRDQLSSSGPHSAKTPQPAPVSPVTIQIAPLPGPIEVGDAVPLEVTRNGGSAHLGPSTIRWASSAPEIAAVDATRGVVTACAPGSAKITGVVDGVSAAIDIVVIPSRAATVVITAPAQTIAVGSSVPLQAVASDRRGVPLARKIRWSTTDPDAATITGDGLLTAHASGTVGVTAACDDVRGELRLTISPPTVAGVQISGAPNELFPGDTAQLSAIALDARDLPIANKRIKWTTDDKAVAAVNSVGLVTATGVGRAVISASCDGKDASTVVAVVARSVAAVEIAPVRGTITTARKFRLEARAVDANGRELHHKIAWRSSDTSIAEVSSDGTVSAKSHGRVRIIAEADGCEGAIELAIAAPAEIPVAPAPAKRPNKWLVPTTAAVLVAIAAPFVYLQLRGRSDAKTDATVVAGVDSANRPTGSADSGKSNMPGQPPDSGIVRGTSSGKGNAADSAKGSPAGDGSATIGILAITPPSNPIVQGDSVVLQAIRKGAALRVQPRDMRWSSSNDRVARVTSGGMVVGLTPGTTRVILTTPVGADTVDLTIVPAPTVAVATIALPQSTIALTVGATTTVRATARDRNGGELSGRTISYTSNEPTIASIDRTGVVTAHKSGSAAITASSEGASSTLVVNVTEPKKDSIVVATDPNAGTGTKNAMMSARRVAAGGSLACATRESGALVCWGRSARIDTVAGSFSQVSIGATHACGLSGGQALCWGGNDQGQLGSGSLGRYAEIAAGGSFTCALDNTGAAFCWGRNNEGQLGTGDKESANKPKPVGGSLTFKAIATGAKHACAVATDNVAYCWGDGFASAVGAGGRREFFTLPTKVDTKQRFTDIVAGDNFSCGLAVNGRVFCWGENRSGQIGDGSKDERERPSEVRGAQTFVQLTAGRYHACGLTNDGVIYCWGDNTQGQLGNGTRASRQTPAVIDSDQRFSSVSAGATHTCAVTKSNAVYCWGSNRQGQLGPGSAATVDSPSPMQVRAP